jgi:hypothetical protein
MSLKRRHTTFDSKFARLASYNPSSCLREHGIPFLDVIFSINKTIVNLCKLLAHAFIVHMLDMMLDNQMERENAITMKSLPPISPHYLVYLHDCEFFCHCQSTTPNY